MGTMSIIIGDIGIVGHEIPTIDRVILLTVTVRVGISAPKMILEVIVVGVGARIKYRHHNILSCISLRPNIIGIHL